MSQQNKAARFKALHERDGAFVIPNPWDPGSARLMQALGFEALATTSSGYANTLGLKDGDVTREMKIAHCENLCAATDLPINADLENCFADDPAEAAKTITLAARAGIVGGSIEDFSTNPELPIYEFEHAVERVAAAVEAARAEDIPFMLTARAEGLLRGVKDMDDTIRRLQAFEKAGADVLYAPALKSVDEISAVVAEISKPLNVLAPSLKGVTVAEMAKAGAKRISIGGALARVMTGQLISASREMLDEGGFGWLKDAAPNSEIERLLDS